MQQKSDKDVTSNTKKIIAAKKEKENYNEDSLAYERGNKIPISKKTSTKNNHDDDHEDDLTEETDEWGKPDPIDDWDPDFNEFDIPPSKNTPPKMGGNKKKSQSNIKDDEEDFDDLDDHLEDEFDDEF